MGRGWSGTGCDENGDLMAGSDQQALVADGLMTVSEAADFLRLSRSSVYALMDHGELAFCEARPESSDT